MTLLCDELTRNFDVIEHSEKKIIKNFENEVGPEVL